MKCKKRDGKISWGILKSHQLFAHLFTCLTQKEIPHALTLQLVEGTFFIEGWTW